MCVNFADLHAFDESEVLSIDLVFVIQNFHNTLHCNWTTFDNVELYGN